jgi:DNA-binding transcriptional ArsR family regulator
VADKTMDRLLEEGRLRKVMDQRLIKALSHPLRAHLLATLNERLASPTEMADEIGLDVAFLSYHVRVLRDFGCIELVETGQRRGATEHFYRARPVLFFDDLAWRQLPASLKSDLSADMLQSILNDLIRAMRAKTFDAREDRHLSWAPILLDEKGWADANSALFETLERIFEIQAECAERLAETNTPGIRATMSMVCFETPARPARLGNGTATSS